jgi:predicted phage-related endonuclease
MNIINCIQGTDEWKKVRLGKLTGSDAHTIGVAGKGLDTLCLKKVAEILTGKAEEGYKSQAMQNGNDLEAEARNAYELETGNIVTQVGFCELDDMVGASPDGLIADDGGLEVKCKTDAVYVKELLGEPIDPEHISQMQFGMMVTGRSWWDYIVYNPNFEKSLIIRRVMRDEVAIAKIKAGVETGKALIKSYLLKIQK